MKPSHSNSLVSVLFVNRFGFDVKMSVGNNTVSGTVLVIYSV